MCQMTHSVSVPASDQTTVNSAAGMLCGVAPSDVMQHNGSCHEGSLAVAGESEPLVAVGTCQAFGEDYPATGRVLFFQITRKPGSGTEEEEEWDTQMLYARSSPFFFGLLLAALVSAS